ncbi:MAG: hypothetical protein U1F53_10320 [Burkholderiaceae bacterium]
MIHNFQPGRAVRVAAVLAALGGLGGAAAAATGDAVAPRAAETAAPLSVTAPLKLQKTWIDNGTAGGLVLAAFSNTPVGTPLIVKCTAAAGCTVGATLELQISQVGVNSPALCFYVDDALIGCPYSDRLSATNGFKLLVHHDMAAVGVGDHKLEMRAYTEVTANAYHYQAEYRLFNLAK